jgi:hypothetical protein
LQVWECNLYEISMNTNPVSQKKKCCTRHIASHPPSFLHLIAAPVLHLLLPPPLALGTQATGRRSGSGSQRRRGNPRLGGGVSGSPSRLSPSPPSSAHRPMTLRTHLPLPYRLRWTIDGARPLRLRCAPRAVGGQREPAATAPPRRSCRVALGALMLMPHSLALPIRLALQRAEACA